VLLRKDLEARIQRQLEDENGSFSISVPYARHLTEPDRDLDDEYYLRHRVETIKRIRMTSRTDALALAHMVDEDYEAARLWSRYAMQEMNHDLLFQRDLEHHGYTPERIAAIPPLASTVAMVDSLTRRIEEMGSLPAVMYSVFVEWNSERSSARVVDKARTQFSELHVTGARAHVGIDHDHAHYRLMLDIVERLLPHDDDDAPFLLLKDVAAWFSAYFRELYEVTVGRRDRDPHWLRQLAATRVEV
jgi:hypothetical protein